MNKNRVSLSMKIACLSVFISVLAGCASNTPAPVVDRGGQRPAAAVSADTYTVKTGDTVYSIAREHGMDFRELIALNGIENPNQIAVGRVLKIKSATAPSQAEGVVTAPITSDVVVAKPLDGQTAVESRPDVASGSLRREPRAGKEPYSDQALAMAQTQTSQPQLEPTKPTEAPAAAKAETKTEPAATGDDSTWAWPTTGKIIGTFGESGNKGIDLAGKAGDPVLAAGDGKVIYSGNTLRGYGNLIIIKHNSTYVSAYAHNQTILVKQDQMVKKGQKIAEIGNSDTNQYKLHFEIRRQSSPVDPLKHLPPR